MILAYTYDQHRIEVHPNIYANPLWEIEMIDSAHEIGVIQTLIERFEKQRLPRLLEIKKRVGKGAVLSELDIRFLDEVTHDVQQNKTLIDRHPEWHKFCAEVIHLNEEIIEKALNNEKQS